ncbi:MAG TPA: chloride channel protein [Ignavibacteriaceae bacterium]|nr:chloride channel protein [Ignavibacteriaceae bacterium]
MLKKNKTIILRLIVKSQQLKRKFQKKFSKILGGEYTTFSFISVIIGIVVGLAAILFHNSIEWLNQLFFNRPGSDPFILGTAAVILIPAAGMLIQAVMILAAPDIAKHKGIPDVIKAVALRGGFISFRTTLFHFIAPIICMGTGGTVGPEGPAAQLGGGIASKLSSLLRISEERIRIFTAAGSGAAIAAIFNAPLGGIFFAFELVLLNDYHAPTFASLILATVSASAVSRIFLGNVSVFQFQIQSVNYSYLYLYAVLGLFAGIISYLFIRYSNWLYILFRDRIYNKRIPQWLGMAAVGLLVGISGYFFKEIFGIGYEAINELLKSSLAWQIVVVIFLLKFLLVPLILNSGGFGGIFAPSLFMGACFGYLFAFLFNSIWGLDLDTSKFVLVGMGAVLGGANTIPISAILIMFEMTQDYTFILPLMLAVIISSMFVQIALKGSVQAQHLEAEGFRISEGRVANLLRSITVNDVDLQRIDLVDENTPLPQLIVQLVESPNSSFYTINSKGELCGIITENEMRPIITEYEIVKNVLVARDVANPEITVVHTSDDLDYILNLFGKLNVDQLPVVDSNNPSKVLGAITRQKVISVYNRESLREDMAFGLAKELKTIDRIRPIKVAADYSIMEVNLPDSFVGKSLVELKIRAAYGIEVLMIKHSKDIFNSQNQSEIVSPDPNYKLKNYDRLIVFGKDEKLKKFFNHQ